jgi:hypothetical protein
MKILIGLLIFLSTFRSFACPVVIELAKNQTEYKIEDFFFFSDYLKKNKFLLVPRGDHEYVLKLRLLKRTNHVNPNLKFAFISVDIFDGDNSLVSYSDRSGSEFKNETRAYSKEAFESVLIDLSRDFKKCEN